MTRLTAAILAVAFTAAVPGMALADCAGHMKTATNPATIVDGSGSTLPPMTPAPDGKVGG